MRSGNDANLNGDSAGDRAIRNPNGVRNTASAVTALTNTAGQVVGYLANNPNAEYVKCAQTEVMASRAVVIYGLLPRFWIFTSTLTLISEA